MNKAEGIMAYRMPGVSLAGRDRARRRKQDEQK